MVVSKPPAHRTTARRPRLRHPFSSLVAFAPLLGALLLVTQPATARPSVKVLLYPTVSDTALSTMSPSLWTKYLGAYVGGNPIVFGGPTAPTIEDCRKAGADYIVIAPFDLRPRLPGMPGATGRINAATHLIVTNCTTKTLALDQIVNFESQPAAVEAISDSAYPSESAWAGSVSATLAKYPLAFQRVAHIIDVHPPYAFVDIRGARSFHDGDAFSDYATADRKTRPQTIVLTVVKVYDAYVEVVFTQPGAPPKNGDLVEPLAKGVSPAR